MTARQTNTRRRTARLARLLKGLTRTGTWGPTAQRVAIMFSRSVKRCHQLGVAY